MPRRAFYSFHYKPDCSRAALVRNIGSVEGNRPASDNDWESIKSRGDGAIRNWIDDQLFGKSCAVVLIGENTAGRKWINYEIRKAWSERKGVFGIYIHRLKDLDGKQASQGANPFDGITIDGVNLFTAVSVYNPPYFDSKDVYKYIADNLSTWFDLSVGNRSKY